MDGEIDVAGLLAHMPIGLGPVPHLLAAGTIPTSEGNLPVLFLWTPHSMDHLVLGADEAVKYGSKLRDIGEQCGGVAPTDLTVVESRLLGPDGTPAG